MIPRMIKLLEAIEGEPVGLTIRCEDNRSLWWHSVVIAISGTNATNEQRIKFYEQLKTATSCDLVAVYDHEVTNYLPIEYKVHINKWGNLFVMVIE